MSIERIPITSREQWLALRRRDVTASDVAVVCGAGASKWKSPLRLYHEKIGDVPEDVETPVMWRGRIMEPAVLAAVREAHPDWEIIQPNAYLRDPNIRIGATLDAIAIVPGSNDPDVILQCKVVNQRTFDAEWQDGPPLQYQLQTLTELHLWGGARAYVCALIDTGFKSELKMYDIARHDAAYATICEKVRDFWATAEAGEIPEADYAMDLGLVKFLYPPQADGPPLDLTGDNRISELLPRRAELALEARRIEDELDATEAEIIDKLRGSASANGPDGWKITYKTVERKEYTVKASTYSQLKATQRKNP